MLDYAEYAEQNRNPIDDDIEEAIKDHIGYCISIQKVDGVGTQLIFHYDNNNGASVVILDEPEFSESPFELAVIRFEHRESTRWLPYPENGLTDKSGLACNLNIHQVNRYLQDIKEL